MLIEKDFAWCASVGVESGLVATASVTIVVC